jgi:hypothetical protein
VEPKLRHKRKGFDEHAEMQVLGEILNRRRKLTGTIYIGALKPCCTSCMAMITAVSHVLNKVELTAEGLNVPIQFEARGTHAKYNVAEVPRFMQDNNEALTKKERTEVKKAFITLMNPLLGKKKIEVSSLKEEEINVLFNRFYILGNPVNQTHVRSAGVLRTTYHGIEEEAPRRSVSPVLKVIRDIIRSRGGSDDACEDEDRSRMESRRQSGSGMSDDDDGGDVAQEGAHKTVVRESRRNRETKSEMHKEWIENAGKPGGFGAAIHAERENVALPLVKKRARSDGGRSISGSSSGSS